LPIYDLRFRVKLRHAAGRVKLRHAVGPRNTLFPPFASVKISARLAKLNVEEEGIFMLHAQMMNAATAPASRINHIFVDFENVPETDLDRIANKPVEVTFVLGERHKTLPVKFVCKILKFAGQVALIETGRSGKNALDLVLAHHNGEARKADPHGYFHIVSKDKDFDALIGHLKDNGALAARHAAFSEIPVLMNLAERLKLLANRFKANPIGRPKKRKTLESQIQAVFGKTLSPGEVEETIHGLVAKKIIMLSEKGDVIYAT
jgi:hypothetical protein